MRYVAKQKTARDALNTTLAELGRKRADLIVAEQKRIAAATVSRGIPGAATRGRAGAGDAFDTKVAEIIAAEALRFR
jgi:hypothetical protein